MIGSGIFIVSCDIAKTVGSAGWLLAVWAISGFITLTAALSYGELSAMFPNAGGQYVYLREAFGKLWGFLYGWAFFAVIQTGTIAAVGVAFGKFAGYLNKDLGDGHILLGTQEGFHISAAQIVGLATIILLTYINTRGVKSGKIIQFVFTSAKLVAIAGLIIFGFALAKDGSIWHFNMTNAFQAMKIEITSGAISHSSLTGNVLILALSSAMVGAIFSSDAWNNVTFIAGELKRPERNIGLSLFLGTLTVTVLYVTMNLMYLHVLSVSEIAQSQDNRVAISAALKIFGTDGAKIIAVLIMISTFGCNNGLILSGARVYYTMAQDGLFLKQAASLNDKGVPQKALWMQCLWACILCLSGQYNVLLGFVVFTVLLFYILTIAGIFKLRKTRPDAPRPYKAFGYPIVPIFYIFIATFICCALMIAEPMNSGMGLLIVLLGIPVYYITQNKK